MSRTLTQLHPTFPTLESTKKASKERFYLQQLGVIERCTYVILLDIRLRRIGNISTKIKYNMSHVGVEKVNMDYVGVKV